MKKLVIIILVLFVNLSCKQKSNPEISIENLVQRYDEIEQVSYNVKQVWKGPIPGSVDSVFGHCSFILEKNDSLVGAQYFLTFKKDIFNLYNGKICIRADIKDKSAKIYNLEDYSVDDKLKIISSPTLYLLSYNDIIKDLKDRLKNNPKSLKILEDTIIDNQSMFRIKSMDQDTVSNQILIKQNTIIFDKESLLPVYVNNLTRTPGGIFKEASIDVAFSQFEISNSPNNKTFDLNSIPFEIQKLTYSTDKKATLKIKDPAPLWSANLINGDSIKSTDLEGKIILLDFTAVNCGYCIKAHEILNRIDDRYMNSQLSDISVFPIDNPQNISYLINKSSIKHSIIYNASQMQKDYYVTSFPTLFLIDKSGKIEYTAKGSSGNLETELTNTIDRLLANN